MAQGAHSPCNHPKDTKRGEVAHSYFEMQMMGFNWAKKSDW